MRLHPVFRPAVFLFLTVAAAGAVPSTVALQSSVNPATFGHSVRLTAAVSPAAPTGSGSPPAAFGSVTFYDGTTILGISRVFNSQAAITTIQLASGVRSLRVFYTGDSNYQPSSSAIFKLTVTALPGNGFQPAFNYVDGTDSVFAAVGDLNGDGILDLAIANATFDTVQVMLGNGDGSFKAPARINAGSGVNFIAIGDFDGDGRADLAVSNGPSNTISVLIGNGDGTFLPLVVYPVDPAPDGIAVGDFNGDGSADLAVATANGVSVLIGDGDGNFQTAVPYRSQLAYSIAVGDFNGDGRADLVIAYPNGIGVLLGLGDGTFGNAVAYGTGLGGGPVVVGDFNGDGRVDIAAAASNFVSVVLGNGDGTFQQPLLSVSGASNSFIQSLAVADFDGDGRSDLVAVNSSGGPSGTNVSVLFGIGNGAFQKPVFYNVTAVTFAGVGDFNGDGRADLVTTGLGPLGVMLAIPGVVVVNPPPPPPVPTVTVAGVVNAASFAKDASGNGTAVAPGSLISIFGSFQGAVQADAAGAPFGASLGQVSVKIAGIAAPIRDVVPAAGEINVQMPFEVPPGSVPASVIVTVNEISSAPFAVPIVPASPGIFTIPPTGLGNAVLVFVDPADGLVKIAAPASASASVGLPTAPIPRGTAAYFYVTGLGAMSPPVADGNGGLEPPVNPHYATNPIVTVGGFTASVAFAGQAPGFPGVNQVNIVIPNAAATGDAVPLQLKSSDGSISSNIATIAIR